MQIRQPALASEADAGLLKALGWIDADDQRGFFGQRQRHAAAAAAGVEDASGQRHPGPIEERDHLRAAVVLEQRVIVLGAEAEVGVRLDGAFVNLSHDRTCR